MEALFDPRTLLKNELAAEALRSFGELQLRVTGSSMLPAVLPGDELLIRRCGIEEAGLNDVVLFLRDRRLLAHRVISRCARHLITRGDGLAEPDSPVLADEMLGKVIRVVRRGKRIPQGARAGFRAWLAAALFRRSGMAGRIFIRVQGLQGRAGT